MHTSGNDIQVFIQELNKISSVYTIRLNIPPHFSLKIYLILEDRIVCHRKHTTAK